MCALRIYLDARESDYTVFSDSTTSNVVLSERQQAIVLSFITLMLERDVWELSTSSWDTYSSYLAEIVEAFQ